MIIATHPPIFLPWPGLFAKAMQADCLVLLDGVQFPRGPSWLTRNRLKGDQGELWLTVPVARKGRGLQSIREVAIQDDRDWRKKHVGSIRQNYARAPYLDDYAAPVESIYAKRHSSLVELNIDLLRFFWEALSVGTKLVLQSELGVAGQGTRLLIDLCRRVGADRLAAWPSLEKHVDAGQLASHGIELVAVRFRPPVYPQLWGRFIYNLSTLDLLLNCGPKSRDILSGR